MKNKRFLILFVAFFATLPLTTVAQDDRIAERVHGDKDTSGFVADVLHWYDANMNYWAVGGLMALESSFIPFPSEVVIPPAVYVASNPETKSGMQIWLIVVFGTLGALIGALINYVLSMWLGRPIIYAFANSRLGHILQLSGEKIERAEEYFKEHGVTSTLIGRLIPVIRQLISIPAGLSKMNIWKFMLYTTLGAGIWNCVLVLLGYLAYQAADFTVIERYSQILSYAIIIIFVAVIAFFVVRHYVKKNKGIKNK